MKKIEDNKYYIQVYDLLFIEDQGLYNIPKSIWDKIFMNDELLDAMDKNSYIELTEQDEISFFNSLDIVFSLNELDELSTEDVEAIAHSLVNLLDDLKSKYISEKDNLAVEERKQLDMQLDVTKYKIRTINDYIRSRVNGGDSTSRIKQ